MTYDQEARARDRVPSYIYKNFANEDIQKLDRIFQNAGRGVVTDRAPTSPLSFEQRYPDAARIKLAR
jgi:hypothetical protein